MLVILQSYFLPELTQVFYNNPKNDCTILNEIHVLILVDTAQSLTACY